MTHSEERFLDEEGRQVVSLRDSVTKEQIGYIRRWSEEDEGDDRAPYGGLWDAFYCGTARDEILVNGDTGQIAWASLLLAAKVRRLESSSRSGGGVLDAEDLAEIMPEVEPGTDPVSKARREAMLRLAVQWTASHPETTEHHLYRLAEGFGRYIDTGRISE